MRSGDGAFRPLNRSLAKTRHRPLESGVALRCSSVIQQDFSWRGRGGRFIPSPCMPSFVVCIAPCCSRWSEFVGCLAASRPPNIVLIISDDQGWRDLHCLGREEIITPNLDRLAREGVRARRAFT